MAAAKTTWAPTAPAARSATSPATPYRRNWRIAFVFTPAPTPRRTLPVATVTRFLCGQHPPFSLRHSRFRRPVEWRPSSQSGSLPQARPHNSRATEAVSGVPTARGLHEQSGLGIDSPPRALQCPPDRVLDPRRACTGVSTHGLPVMTGERRSPGRCTGMPILIRHVRMLRHLRLC